MLAPEDKEQLTAQLMRHEGAVRNKAGLHIVYRCAAGARTVGYGHNLDAEELPGFGPDPVLTEDQARRLLERDIAKVEKRLQQALGFWPQLTPARQAALVNMGFNLGVPGLLVWSNTLGDIRRGEYARAARRMRASLWAKQVKGRALELADQMETGEWRHVA